MCCSFLASHVMLLRSQCGLSACVASSVPEAFHHGDVAHQPLRMKWGVNKRNHGLRPIEKCRKAKRTGIRITQHLHKGLHCSYERPYVSYNMLSLDKQVTGCRHFG